MIQCVCCLGTERHIESFNFEVLFQGQIRSDCWFHSNHARIVRIYLFVFEERNLDPIVLT